VSQSDDVGGRDQEIKQNSKHVIGRRGLMLAIAAAVLLLWVAHMFRFEVIPIVSNLNGVTQYIVKDRWTGEIESVWQTPDGKVRRSSRQALE
jgi:hypothetical protein